MFRDGVGVAYIKCVTGFQPPLGEFSMFPYSSYSFYLLLFKVLVYIFGRLFGVGLVYKGLLFDLLGVFVLFSVCYVPPGLVFLFGGVSFIFL